jgi:hypothetical protein
LLQEAQLMSDARPNLRAVPVPAPRPSAEREIAVRFTSTSGLIARLYKPLNSFRWVGPATLRFGSQGVLIKARRATWLGLRQTQRLITPSEIRDVYREANAVQVHLHGSRGAYFRLWAEDSASAAQIVELLPTKHTIEFESAIREPPIVISWRVPAIGLAVLSVLASLGTLIWVAAHRGPAVREPTAAPLPQPRPAVPGVKPEPVATGDDALLAEQDLRVFGARIEALSYQFQVAWDALQDGGFSQHKFADELDQWLRPEWDALEARVRRTDAAPGSARERADHELMGVINNWQLALYAYADDLRKQRQVVRSFEYLRRAEEHRQRALRMRSELERSLAAETSPDTNPPESH